MLRQKINCQNVNHIKTRTGLIRKILQRILVNMRRFIYRARKLPTYSRFIHCIELKEALKVLMKRAQFQEFHTLWNSSSDIVISPALAHLSPFIDTDYTIQVGDRFRNSNSTQNLQCLILLTKACIFTTLSFIITTLNIFMPDNNLSLHFYPHVFGFCQVSQLFVTSFLNVLFAQDIELPTLGQ